MNNNSEKQFICHLSSILPERIGGKRGTKPIEKDVLITELFKLFKTNCGWRNIKHSSVCRNYFMELQRRGSIKKYFNLLIKDYSKQRLDKSIVDSSDIVNYNTNGIVKYSGKYHNPCVKLTIEVSSECVPVYGRLDKGSESDSVILDKMLEDKDKLPYELYADKGYEKYDRRRELKKRNCQVRIEMKKLDKNRKRGPRFIFTSEHKRMRGSIEKVMAWIKTFMIVRLSRIRIKSLISGMFFFCLSYTTFTRLKKL